MKITREQLVIDIEDFIRKGGVIQKCEPEEKRDITWQKDWNRSDVLNRMGGVVPAGMVPFKRNVGKGE